VCLCVSARLQSEQCQYEEKRELQQCRQKPGSKPLVGAGVPNCRQHGGSAGQENSSGQNHPEARETPMNVEPFQAYEQDLGREESQPCGCGKPVKKRGDAHRAKRDTRLHDAAKEE
jgi:hypothetical protein